MPTSTTESAELLKLRCPQCVESEIAEIDLLIGYAGIAGFREDGGIEWSGSTDIDWNSQRPEKYPPEFLCRNCEKGFRGLGKLVKTYSQSKETP